MNGDNLSIKVIGSPVPIDNAVRLGAEGLREPHTWRYHWKVTGPGGVDVTERLVNADTRFDREDVDPRSRWVDFHARDVRPGVYTVHVTATKSGGGGGTHERTESIVVQTRALTKDDSIRVTREGEEGPLEVSLLRTDVADTPDLPLWSVIRASTDKISYNNY